MPSLIPPPNEYAARSPSRATSVALAVAVLLLARSSRADEINACVTSHRLGQELRQQGSLRAARGQFLRCSSDACPALVRDDCARWTVEVEEQSPTVVFAARDALGQDLRHVTVSVDGTPLVGSLTGKAVAVDPGRHRFRFERPDGVAIEVDRVIRPNEKNQTIDVAFRIDAAPARAPASPSPPSPAKAPGKPTAAYVAFAVGGVAAVSFTAFAIGGYARFTHLESRCAPTCTREDHDSVARTLAIADVSLLASVVSLGIGAVLWWWPSGFTKSSTSAPATLSVLPVLTHF